MRKRKIKVLDLFAGAGGFSYTIAKLARLVGQCSGRVLDLRGIWDNQGVSEATSRQLAVVSKEVFSVIVSPDKEFQNITEWCKKKACWDRADDLDIPLLPEFIEGLIDTVKKKALEKTAKGQQIIDTGIDVQRTVVEKGDQYWAKLRAWARQHKLVSPEEDKILGVASKLSVGMMPDVKQCRKLLVVKDRAEGDGFIG